MSRSPVLILLVAAQVVASLVFAGLSVVWLIRTRDMTQLAVRSNAEMAKVAQLRQGVGALLQDSVAYSERNPAMKTLLQQLGVKVNAPGNSPQAPQPNANRR
jgi:outer membrane murein-binding lipoprotein Lpp